MGNQMLGRIGGQDLRADVPDPREGYLLLAVVDTGDSDGGATRGAKGGMSRVHQRQRVKLSCALEHGNRLLGGLCGPDTVSEAIGKKENSGFRVPAHAPAIAANRLPTHRNLHDADGQFRGVKKTRHLRRVKSRYQGGPFTWS
jgi:hypothetical protein